MKPISRIEVQVYNWASHKGKAVRITSIAARPTVDGEPAYWTELFPIKLDPEVLDSVAKMLGKRIKTCTMTYDPGEKKGWMVTINMLVAGGVRAGERAYISQQVEYVHQLQNIVTSLGWGLNIDYRSIKEQAREKEEETKENESEEMSNI